MLESKGATMKFFKVRHLFIIFFIALLFLVTCSQVSSRESTVSAQFQVYDGQLGSHNSRLIGDQYYVDFFRFEAINGQEVVLDLSSQDFDTYLIVLSPSEKIITNDDYEGSLNISHLQFLTDESGDWYIMVTSYEEKETGVYKLSIDSHHQFSPDSTFALDPNIDRRVFQRNQPQPPPPPPPSPPEIRYDEYPELATPPAIGLDEYPEFPWPPPKSSAVMIIPNELLMKPIDHPINLFEVENGLSTALGSCGYDEKTYYAVPRGFAIVTRIEKIDPDGMPKESQERWSIEIKPLRTFSLSAYARALFTANPGYYRVIVFIVTPLPFNQTDEYISRREAVEWLRAGMNSLPASIGELGYTSDYKCTVLIYEFEQLESEKDAILKIPGRLSAKTHLEKAHIWEMLEK